MTKGVFYFRCLNK